MADSGRSGLTGTLEWKFHKFLWYFRFVVVLGVVGLRMGSSLVFVLGILETASLVGDSMTRLDSRAGTR